MRQSFESIENRGSWREDRAPLIAVAALAVVCIACLLANHDLPLVRNGIVYARAAEHVIEHHYDGLAVVADSKLSYDKPIGFSWFAAPLLALCGTNLGLELVSCVGSLAYLLALFCFARAFDPFRLTSRERAILIVLAGCGPIVAYQSWSAHPDSLYAALYVGTFTLAHRLVERPGFGRLAWITLAIFASLLLKNYGAILIPSVGLYALFKHRADQLVAEATLMAEYTFAGYKRDRVARRNAAASKPPRLGRAA